MVQNTKYTPCAKRNKCEQKKTNIHMGGVLWLLATGFMTTMNVVITLKLIYNLIYIIDDGGDNNFIIWAGQYLDS